MGDNRTGEWTCGCMRWQDVLALAPNDLTYRQLNHWTTALGILTGHHHNQDGRHLTSEDIADRGKPIGSGFAIGWTPQDAHRAAFAAHVIAATSAPRVSGGGPAGGAHIPVELAFRLADGPVMVSIGGEPYCLTLLRLIPEGGG